MLLSGNTVGQAILLLGSKLFSESGCVLHMLWQPHFFLYNQTGSHI
jgi:hypothetical protein